VYIYVRTYIGRWLLARGRKQKSTFTRTITTIIPNDVFWDTVINKRLDNASALCRASKIPVNYYDTISRDKRVRIPAPLQFKNRHFSRFTLI